MTAPGSRLRVTLYSRPGCHLCDDLKRDLLEMQAALAFDLDERNIDEHAEDFARFRSLIPVLDVPGGPLLTPPHDWSTVRTAIERATAAMATEATEAPEGEADGAEPA
jgi:hypothetical protein